jgi:hypothetical protein
LSLEVLAFLALIFIRVREYKYITYR